MKQRNRLLRWTHSFDQIQTQFRFLGIILVFPLVASIMESCDKTANVPPPPPPPAKTVLHASREVPQQVGVGETFTVRLTIQVDEAVPAVLVKELLGGLTLVDKGSEFTIAEKDSLQGVILKPSAGATTTFTYKLRCPKAIPYTIVAEASTRNIDPAYAITTVTCIQK